jgi:hypothetical protein
MKKFLSLTVVSGAALVAMATPAYAFAPEGSKGADAPGFAVASGENSGCAKQLGGKQKVSDTAHKGVGGEENYPSNCDHFFNG